MITNWVTLFRDRSTDGADAVHQSQNGLRIAYFKRPPKATHESDEAVEHEIRRAGGLVVWAEETDDAVVLTARAFAGNGYRPPSRVVLLTPYGREVIKIDDLGAIGSFDHCLVPADQAAEVRLLQFVEDVKWLMPDQAAAVFNALRAPTLEIRMGHLEETLRREGRVERGRGRGRSWIPSSRVVAAAAIAAFAVVVVVAAMRVLLPPSSSQPSPTPPAAETPEPQSSKPSSTRFHEVDAALRQLLESARRIHTPLKLAPDQLFELVKIVGLAHGVKQAGELDKSAADFFRTRQDLLAPYQHLFSYEVCRAAKESPSPAGRPARFPGLLPCEQVDHGETMKEINILAQRILPPPTTQAPSGKK